MVKGGGHSYQGTSNAADSLLIWTRHMNAMTLHDAFVGAGCEGRAEPQPAVSVEPGAIWGHVYNEVTTKGGRYVQGGGCLTVGVAGLVLGGGFGSFSKAYGTAGANLIEAEVVTADGEVKIANACTNPDLFWALKGGGGGFGVVTRVTLRTHELPIFSASCSRRSRRRPTTPIADSSRKSSTSTRKRSSIRIGASRSCIGRGDVVDFDGVPGPRPATGGGDVATVLRLGRRFAAGFRHRIGAADPCSAGGATFLGPRRFSRPFRARDRRRSPRRAGRQHFLGRQPRGGGRGLVRLPIRLAAGVAARSRPAPKPRRRVVRGGEASGRGAALQQGACGRAGGRNRRGKGYGDESSGTDAFALAITGAFGQPAYPGVPGHEPDEAAAQAQFDAVDQSMDEIRKLLPRVGSYVWETDFFQPNWQDAFWGENYARLRAIKQKYDPDGLFFLHHGVGSEDWSADGFTRTN